MSVSYRTEQPCPTSGCSDDYAYSRHFVDSTKTWIGGFCIEWGKDFQPPWSEMEQIILDISAGLIEFCLATLPSDVSSAIHFDLTESIWAVLYGLVDGSPGVVINRITGEVKYIIPGPHPGPDWKDILQHMSIHELAKTIQDETGLEVRKVALQSMRQIVFVKRKEQRFLIENNSTHWV
jgi:hypothetical protein